MIQKPKNVALDYRRFSLTDTLKQVAYVNNEESIKNDVKDLKNRFEHDTDQMRKSIKIEAPPDDKTVTNFDMDAN